MKRLLFLHIFLLSTLLAWAQVATTFPYECSFEEGEDLSAWTLNYGNQNTTDQWMVGTAVHSEGRRSLYISADGQNPNYGKKPNIAVSVLKYKFPTMPNRQAYDVSFDWKGMGDSTNSKLYVMVCPEQQLTNTAANNYYNIDAIVNQVGGRLSNGQVGVCQSLGESGEKFVCGSETWQNVSLTNTVGVSATNSQRNYAFIFIWVNANSQDSIGRTSIAIDNFQINSAAIKKPENLIIYPHCEDSTLIVTWDINGPFNEFDIQYRKVGETGWNHGVSGITEGPDGFTLENGTHCTYSLKRILEGSYDVRIRTAYYDPEENKTLRSNYAYESMILVYCPENHCINYVDLYSPNVTCTYGFNPEAHTGATPYDSIGVIDFGPDAIESRHTLHVDPTEVDPRTDSLLKTVPDGALASVRLGNWHYMGEAESITYDILVDSTNQGILICKYAVVFENIENHRNQQTGKLEGEQRFTLEVLDSIGQLIDETCGNANFTYTDAEESGWNITRDGTAWKDWTTIGVNLMPYHGQTIKVRFTTMDCGWSGHYAYAYFTVDCANAHIETENCGNDAQVTCIAPDGFAYAWYNQNGDTVSHDQTFIVDASRQLYTCRVSFIEQPDCYFEISTTSEPRFPVPDYTFEPVYENCMSQLRFSNHSHVMNMWEGEEKHTTEPTNESRWTFRSLTTGQTRTSTTTNPTYTCREYGDSVEVTLTAYIGADNSCDSTRVDTIIVPNIVPDSTEFHIETCSETPIKFDGKWFDRDTVYKASFPNFAGCDSVSTLYLHVYPTPKDTYRHDSICSNQKVNVGGRYFNVPMVDSLIMLKTPNGCDSAVYLTLTVNQLLNVTIDSLPYACADEEQMYILFDITEGIYDSLVIKFNTPLLRDTVIYDQVSTVAIPYDANILPGHYSANMRFYQFCCGTYTRTRGFDIRYRSSIVEQKWNDVLTLLSPKYNGGYEFTAYQWYKNDMPLEGETHSYLYQPLDFEAEYYVEVVRKDGVMMKTCPIQPIYHEQQSEYPTVVKAAQRVPVYMEHSATIWYYTVSGQLYSSFTLPQGYADLPTPEQPGIFVLKAVNAQGETKAQVMIVQ